jgi:hypothetical protein
MVQKAIQLLGCSLVCVALVSCSDATRPEPDPLAELTGTWVHVGHPEDLSRLYVSAVTIHEDGSVDRLGVELATGRLALLGEGAYAIDHAGDGRITIRTLFGAWNPPEPSTSGYTFDGDHLGVVEDVGPFRSAWEYVRMASDERVIEPVDLRVTSSLHGDFLGEDPFADQSFLNDHVSSAMPALAVETPAASGEGGSQLELTARSGQLWLRLVLDDVRGSGVYDGSGGGVLAELTRIGGDALFGWRTDETDPVMRVEITEFDRDRGRCSGTFSASLSNFGMPAYRVDVADGEFEVPLVEEPPGKRRR